METAGIMSKPREQVKMPTILNQRVVAETVAKKNTYLTLSLHSGWEPNVCAVVAT